MTKHNLEEVICGDLGSLHVATANSRYTKFSDGSRTMSLRSGDMFTAVSAHNEYRGLIFDSCDLHGDIKLIDGNVIRLDKLLLMSK